jgi:hypothetical protein
MTKEEALNLVMNCATSYAGEIGFADSEYAEDLYAAVAILMGISVPELVAQLKGES